VAAPNKIDSCNKFLTRHEAPLKRATTTESCSRRQRKAPGEEWICSRECAAVLFRTKTLSCPSSRLHFGDFERISSRLTTAPAGEV
jgi:hypothetical protein